MKKETHQIYCSSQSIYVSLYHKKSFQTSDKTVIDMKWRQCNCLAIMATVLLFLLPENSLAFGNSSLFSTALRNRRVYDTSLQSSIIRLIRELMLTPKVYDSMVNAEKRADSGRVLFPGQISSQTSSQSQQQYRSEEPRPARPMILTARNFNSNGGGSWRPGKVERVPRPIIINGNNAAMNAPRYNRMIEGPAPTVGSSIKIPQPSVIMSQPLRVLEGDRDSRGRSLKEIDVQGVRVIVGQRVPDDPEDKLFTWRNGRVIKGMFFPNDPSNSRPVNQEESNDISKPSSLVVSSSYSF
ncbi:hypothetical protein Ocin01_14177 [Orchesella cincta]|uniref:Uncharacterized protein n=1 Tax=Orchesella cincta TaxID=48709 RepID=A0A1D2MHK9_ORCCI|nr:hypothetical protein Ocin01_14177 [Orchesella cincta]